MPNSLRDRLGRPLKDLRLSITDRCNFRCTYCMPREVFGPGYQFLPKASLLSFEELARIARIFQSLGVEKIRLTGGEPLMRRQSEQLVAMLAESGLDLAMTTNGALLAPRARALREAGLRRLTVSLDALDPAVFARINDTAHTVEDVLAGIQAALEAGFAPLKLNMVVRRGLNDDQIPAVLERFSSPDTIVRFIEYMDVGTTNGWNMTDVIPSAGILERIARTIPLEPLDPNYPGEVARRWRRTDTGAEIGVISSVTQPFCRECTRARLTVDGQLFTCLFASKGHDLRTPLRDGTSDAGIAARVAGIWGLREDRYSELRGEANAPQTRAEMSLLGG